MSVEELDICPPHETPAGFERSELVAALCRRWAYSNVNQVGSHVVLQTDEPSSHRVAIPGHKALRVGTLNAILAAVAKHKGVTREAILQTVR